MLIKAELLNSLSKIVKSYLTRNYLLYEKIAILLVDLGENTNIDSKFIINWCKGKSLPKDLESKQALPKLVTRDFNKYPQLICDADIVKTIFISSIKEADIKYTTNDLNKLKRGCTSYHGHPSLLDIISIKTGIISRSKSVSIMRQIAYFFLKST